MSPQVDGLSTVAVAASGGRDSTALLHAVARAARALGLHVVALHVHHGLNAQADNWLHHLQIQCRRWQRAGLPLSLDHRRLHGAPAPGQSVEAWARAGRYQALSEMAQTHGASLLLLAHHQRDQAETVLLQSLRGAGASGLSGMPKLILRAGLTWARPWLDQPVRCVASYVQRHRLSHVDDGSNQDLRFARNRLRHAVWPAFIQSFPDAETSLCQVARHAQRAAALTREMAASDLQSAQSTDGALLVAPWLTLSAARRWGTLRAWLQPVVPDGVPETLLQRLLEELPEAPGGARWPLTDQRWISLYRGRLMVRPAAGTEEGAALAIPPPVPAMALDQPGRHRLPGWAGCVDVRAVTQGGLPASRLRTVLVRGRCTGDQFQTHVGGVARSLKKQFQAHGVPPWQRSGPVLVDLSGQVLWVAGLGGDARVPTPAVHEAQFVLAWCPDEAPTIASRSPKGS